MTPHNVMYPQQAAVRASPTRSDYAAIRGDAARGTEKVSAAEKRRSRHPISFARLCDAPVVASGGASRFEPGGKFDGTSIQPVSRSPL